VPLRRPNVELRTREYLTDAEWPGSPRRLRWVSYAQVGSVQCRVVFVFGISVRYTMLFELLSLEIHLFKNALAGQLGRATTLTEPNPCVLSE
jgi:ABC-type microcin C transport system permease subunit YejE